jgi:hypothetical protein
MRRIADYQSVAGIVKSNRTAGAARYRRILTALALHAAIRVRRQLLSIVERRFPPA